MDSPAAKNFKKDQSSTTLRPSLVSSALAAGLTFPITLSFDWSLTTLGTNLQTMGHLPSTRQLPALAALSALSSLLTVYLHSLRTFLSHPLTCLQRVLELLAIGQRTESSLFYCSLLYPTPFDVSPLILCFPHLHISCNPFSATDRVFGCYFSIHTIPYRDIQTWVRNHTHFTYIQLPPSSHIFRSIHAHSPSLTL